MASGSAASNRPPRGYLLKTITVPGNLLQACDEFNSAKFFECHETFEEIWQEEQGEVRDLYKGLIQVAAAFVHASRDNPRGTERLLTTALGYLEPYRADGAMGFDVEEVCEAAERALVALRAGGVEAALAAVPRYTCDTAVLPAEAVRWRAWGFDRDGVALPMEIAVPD